MFVFFAGLALSFAGSIPPGLISLSVAQTAIQRTRKAAVWLGLGAAWAEFFQAWGAIAFAQWLLYQTRIEHFFHGAAAIIFILLGIWMLTRTPKVTDKAAPVIASNPLLQFVRGAVISIFNLLAIPYWLVYYGWLRAKGWWPETAGQGAAIIFSSGVTVGTFITLLLYAYGARWLTSHSKQTARYANIGIGLLFVGLGINEIISFLT